MRTLVALAISVCGGEDEFAAEWCEHWQEVRENHIGHKERLQCFAALLNMQSVIHANTPPEMPNPMNMTDEELAEEMDLRERQWLRQNPHTVSEILGSLGWTVIPPTE